MIFVCCFILYSYSWILRCISESLTYCHKNGTAHATCWLAGAVLSFLKYIIFPLIMSAICMTF